MKECWSPFWGHIERDSFILESWGHLIGKHPLSWPTLVSMSVTTLVTTLKQEDIIEERIIFSVSIRFLL